MIRFYLQARRKDSTNFEYEIVKHETGEKRDVTLHVYSESRVEEALSKLLFYYKKYCDPFKCDGQDVISEMQISVEEFKNEIQAAKEALKQDYESKNVTELKKIISDLKIGVAAKTKEAMVKQIMAFIAKGG